MIRKQNIGSSFDDFLEEEGLLEVCEEQAIKAILADQVKAAMASEGLSKTQMAQRMKTSRQALDRLLDPLNTGVTLQTMQRAASAVGRKLSLELQGPYEALRLCHRHRILYQHRPMAVYRCGYTRHCCDKDL